MTKFSSQSFRLVPSILGITILFRAANDECMVSRENLPRIVGIIVEQYDSLKRKGVFMVQDADPVQWYANSFTHTSIF